MSLNRAQLIRGIQVSVKIGLAMFLVAIVAGEAAYAEDSGEEVVGVLRVESSGVSETAGTLFEDSIEEGLEGSGFRVMKRAALWRILDNTNFVAGCDFGPCLRVIDDKADIRLVVVARIQGEGTSYGFIISLIDTKTGHHTSQVSQTCDVCTVEEAILSATGAVIEAMTGTGDALVADQAAGPTGAQKKKAIREQEKRTKQESRRRKAGWVFAGLGVASAVTGALLWSGEKERSGAGLLGGGLGIGLGGASMLLLSGEF